MREWREREGEGGREEGREGGREREGGRRRETKNYMYATY